MSVTFTARTPCPAQESASELPTPPSVLTNNVNGSRLLNFLVYPQFDPTTGGAPTRDRPSLIDAVDFLASILIARCRPDDSLYLAERLSQLQRLAEFAILHGCFITWHYDF